MILYTSDIWIENSLRTNFTSTLFDKLTFIDNILKVRHFLTDVTNRVKLCMLQSEPIINLSQPHDQTMWVRVFISYKLNAQQLYFQQYILVSIILDISCKWFSWSTHTSIYLVLSSPDTLCCLLIITRCQCLPDPNNF